MLYQCIPQPKSKGAAEESVELPTCSALLWSTTDNILQSLAAARLQEAAAPSASYTFAMVPQLYISLKHISFM